MSTSHPLITVAVILFLLPLLLRVLVNGANGKMRALQLPPSTLRRRLRALQLLSLLLMAAAISAQLYPQVVPPTWLGLPQYPMRVHTGFGPSAEEVAVLQRIQTVQDTLSTGAIVGVCVAFGAESWASFFAPRTSTNV